MAHTHHHEDDGSYYMEQVCTIAISGLLGLVAILLYTSGKLNLLLNAKLHWTVLAGGIALVILTAVRALAVWLPALRRQAAPHDHEHAHDHDHAHCDHDHAHDHHHDHAHCDHDHDHDHAHAVTAGAAGHTHAAGVPHSHDEGPAGPDPNHDHGHEHGWAPWRYAVLMLPVVLFFLNLPNEGFRTLDAADVGGLDQKKEQVADKGFDPELGFRELEGAAYSEDRRSLYEGKTVRLKGQFAPSGNDRMFSLVRFKINCCAADAIPLSAVIMIDPDSKETVNPAQYAGRWVEVTGQVQFRSREKNGREEWVTVIMVRPDKDHPLSSLIVPTPPDARPFV
jgi:hypothetical protein